MIMFPEFTLDPEPTEARKRTPEDEAMMAEIERRMLKEPERARLELLLLARLKELKPELNRMLVDLAGYHFENGFYRFYHGSFKVYGVEASTLAAVELLKQLMPERKLNLQFDEIIRDGTGRKFDLSVNDNWSRETRPLLEAFAHAKFMVEMAVRYADAPEPPHPLPTGYAALLYLFDLR